MRCSIAWVDLAHSVVFMNKTMFTDAACKVPVVPPVVTTVSYPTTCRSLAFLGAPNCYALGTPYSLQVPFCEWSKRRETYLS